MDIDIDLRPSFEVTAIFSEVVQASMVDKDKRLKPHPCGAYFQHIAKDCVTGLAAIPYKKAEELGFYKIDFLHLSILDLYESKEEIRDLSTKEPNWNLLQVPSVVAKLSQIHDHIDVLQLIKPTSVQTLADCIALIRPAKRYLLDDYVKNPKYVRNVLYKKTKGYYYKKPHAIAYALNIVLQLHLIEADRL